MAIKSGDATLGRAEKRLDDRTIRGLINTIGTIGAGTGFTVSHTRGSGIYVINFNTPFTKPPTVVAASIAQARKIHVIQSQKTFTTVGATDERNNFQDGGFHFIVVGN